MNALRAYYFFVFAMFAVVVPHYQLYLNAIGYSPRGVGILIGFFEVAGVAGPIVFGRLADRSGRYRELKIASATGAAVFLPLLLLDIPVAFAIVVSSAAGFLFKTSAPLTDAVAGTVLADPREEFGKVRVFGSLGFAATSLLIPIFPAIDTSSTTSMLIAFLIAIAVFTTVVLIVPAPIDPAAHQPAGAPASRREKGLPRSYWFVVGTIGVGNIAFGAYNSFFSLYLREELGINAVTLYWAIGALSEIPIIFYSGKLIRRFGTGTMLITAGAMMALRMILYATRPTPPLVVFIQMLHAVSFGLMLSAGIAYVNQVTALDRRGSATAAFNGIGIGLAVFVGAVVGGQLVEVFSFTGMFAIIAICPATSAALFVILRRRDPALLPYR